MFNSELHNKIKELESNVRFKSEVIRDREFEIKMLERRLKNEEESREKEITYKVQEVTTKLTTELEVAKKEAECLSSAINAVGFDVKDSKDMMIKMIEALSKKTDLNLIQHGTNSK